MSTSILIQFRCGIFNTISWSSLFTAVWLAVCSELRLFWTGSYLIKGDQSTIHPSCLQAVDGTWSSLGGTSGSMLYLCRAICWPYPCAPQSCRSWPDFSQDTEIQPLISACLLELITLLQTHGCGQVCLCVCAVLKGERLQSLSRDRSSFIPALLLEAGCYQGFPSQYSCTPVHPPGGFFTPLN